MADIAVFPVVELEVNTVVSRDAVLVRFAFLSHVSQPMEQADPGRRYALSRVQARQVADAICAALRELESAGSQSPPGTRQ